MDARTRFHDYYTVGWICALPVETAAAKLMLEKIHPPLPRLPMDQNIYILGSIGEHNIVIASLPIGVYPTTSAATVGMQLLSTFHSIRFGLMVGIGGGVRSSNVDIRLGVNPAGRTGTGSGWVHCPFSSCIPRFRSALFHRRIMYVTGIGQAIYCGIESNL
jgi:hypothetical protein